MWNAANKIHYLRFIAGALIISASLICGSCASDKSRANDLLTQAREAVGSGDFAKALALLDSLDSSYPGQLDTRKSGMSLRPEAIEGLTLLQLSAADSVAVTLQASVDSLSTFMTRVDNIVEPYMVPSAGYTPDFATKGDGLQARVGLEGDFYLISALNSKPIGHTSVTLAIGGESVTTPTVPIDGELNSSTPQGEVITYSFNQSQPVADLCAAHPGESGSLTFNSPKGSRSMPFTAEQAAAIAQAYRLSAMVIKLREAQIQKDKLNQTLIVARNQRARLNNPSK